MTITIEINILSSLRTLASRVLNHNYVDLGLPSGTLWAANNALPDRCQFCTHKEAVEEFGDELPSDEDWEELLDNCRAKWNKKRKGYTLTGPNGNTLFLPANGLIETSYGEEIIDKGFSGCYWSSTEIIQGIGGWIAFSDESTPHNPDVLAKETTCCSVRLIRKP